METSFLLEYIRHPKTIGAVAPSGRRLAENMMKSIDFNNCKCITEYGAGTGVFTAELIRRRKNNTSLLIIEQNKYFCNLLYKRFGKLKNVHIINGDARRLKEYMSKYGISSVDYIISGLPFASLPKNISDEILSGTEKILSKSNGKFITFQYTLLKKALFERFFHIENVRYTIRNLPSAFVLTMNPKHGKS